MNNNYVKNLINKIVSEQIGPILIKEAQISSEFQNKLNNIFSTISFNIPDVFQEKSNEAQLKSEFKNKINSKINKAQKQTYDYGNLYIMKLGTFFINNRKNRAQFGFQNLDHKLPEGFNPNTFAILIYNDTILDIIPTNDFISVDKNLLDTANEFIKKNKINLSRKGENNKVVVFGDLNNPNEIDVTDYSTYQPKTIKPNPVIEPKKAKEKADYRAGRPLDHPKFGTGIIISSKKKGVNPEGQTEYLVTTDFPNFGRKVILMKTKKK